MLTEPAVEGAPEAVWRVPELTHLGGLMRGEAVVVECVAWCVVLGEGRSLRWGVTGRGCNRLRSNTEQAFITQLDECS